MSFCQINHVVLVTTGNNDYHQYHDHDHPELKGGVLTPGRLDKRQRGVSVSRPLEARVATGNGHIFLPWPLVNPSTNEATIKEPPPVTFISFFPFFFLSSKARLKGDCQLEGVSRIWISGVFFFGVQRIRRV